ncbi:MAG: hypothetical protein K6T85_05485, partial [Gorillibacterium sp.]|nr:hypothetical protein [Gorillibacterium sp.]
AGTWEVEITYFPMPIEHPDRPFYPYMLMIADRKQNSVIGVELAREREDFAQELLGVFLHKMITLKVKPAQIAYRTDLTRDVFEKTCQTLKIRLEHTPDLPMVEEVYEDMSQHFE